jgi:hypothetical protein
MRPWIPALACVMAAGGCQTSPPDAAARGEERVVAHRGDAIVAAAGTPFYLAFKTAFCAASVAIAAPVAALAAMSESRFAPGARRDLGDGVSQNCGPPYVLSPYEVASAAPAYGQVPPPLAAEPGELDELPPPATGAPIELLEPQ